MLYYLLFAVLWIIGMVLVWWPRKVETRPDFDFLNSYAEACLATFPTEIQLPVGWQGWEGGDCPITEDMEIAVKIMCRSGKMYEIGYSAHLANWSHNGSSGDIVAWRVA